MAGSRDTPEARRRRETAQTVEPATPKPRVRQPKAIPADGKITPRFGRRAAPGQETAFVASAAKIDLADRKAVASMRRRRQAWQSEAWDYAEEVGELGYATEFVANLMSKLRLFCAVQPDPAQGPIPVDDEESGIDPTTAKIAMDTLHRLRSLQGGQSTIVRDITTNLEIAGEGYLHGHDDLEEGVEDWNVRSVDELVIQGDRFALRAGVSMTVLEPIPTDDLVIRIWHRHARFSNLAVCPMRRVLGEAEALLLLSREIRASSKSRLSNGILLVPSELSFGPIDPTRAESGGEDEDPFDVELREAMITPIQEEGSASAVVPLVVRGPADVLEKVRHLALDRTMDPVLDQRIEARIVRIARGLDLPVEVVSGLMATTFSNAAVIKRSIFDDHIQPRAVRLVDAITAGYLQWALVEAGIAKEMARQIFVWYDPTQIIARPDQSDQATKAHEDVVISDEARRRYLGFTESDAPDDDEVLRRLMLHATRMDPFIFAQLLKITGLAPTIDIPAPQGGILGAPTVAPPALPAVAAASIPPADQWRELGTRLAEIDRDLRLRIHAALDAALTHALERAGNRIRSRIQRDKGGTTSPAAKVAASTKPAATAAALGPSLVAAVGLSDEELLGGAFDDVVARVGTWIDAAWHAALTALDRVAPIAPASREATTIKATANRDQALGWLAENMAILAQRRLYGQSLDNRGEVDPTTSVPMSLARGVVGIAGGAHITKQAAVRADGGADVELGGAWVDLGGPMVAEGGGPVGGIGTGPDVGGLVAEGGGGIEGYQWDYGPGIRKPFEPHLQLDGVEFENFDDDVLANTEGWPEVDFWFPGDHEGCACDVTPILIGPEGEISQVTASGESLVDEAVEEEDAIAEYDDHDGCDDTDLPPLPEESSPEPDGATGMRELLAETDDEPLCGD